MARHLVLGHEVVETSPARLHHCQCEARAQDRDMAPHNAVGLVIIAEIDKLEAQVPILTVEAAAVLLGTPTDMALTTHHTAAARVVVLSITLLAISVPEAVMVVAEEEWPCNSQTPIKLLRKAEPGALQAPDR